MIAYSQCWEDAELMLKALRVNKDDTVLSISSGGCNTLALSARHPKTLFAIDYNPDQNYLLELKLVALQQLPYHDAVAFLGYADCPDRMALYAKLHGHLSAGAQVFWQSQSQNLSAGVVHCGKFEQYMALFRKKALPLVHSKIRLEQLVAPRDAEAQKQFYLQKWDSFRWRLMFHIFFSKRVMSGRGRNKEMFSQLAKNTVAARLYKRTARFLMAGPVSENFYLNYIFWGKSIDLPLYLSLPTCHRVLEAQPINIKTIDLLSFLQSMPNNSINKFNLSDVFEPIPESVTDTIFGELYRVAAPNARIVFWNNLVRRDVPQSLKTHFVAEKELEHELCRQNKVFFYERFYIYAVRKEHG